MSIMRTKGVGASANSPKVTPSASAHIAGLKKAFTQTLTSYQQNQTQKNPNFDTIRKLVIQNYVKDLGSGVFWGWDIISADETEESYLFQLRNRNDGKLRIYITLGRELQTSDLDNNLYQMYQCYMCDDLGEWSERIWFDYTNLNHKSFWDKVERLVDKHHPLLPF